MVSRRRIIVRNDTAANWTAVNPTLAKGEIGIETDTNKLKIGDGATAWASLAYMSGSSGAAWGSITGTLSSQSDLNSALSGKANSTHTHAINDVTGLQTALDNKAAASSVGLKLYIQSTTPSFAVGEKALWIDTTGGNMNFWIQDGT